MALPPDDHTHTEWSWDTTYGSMEGSCARAVELGLPAIAFTEHVDRARWRVTGPRSDPGAAAALKNVSARVAKFVQDDGCFHAPPLDVDGYLACVERCRAKFPTLRILTGVELGEPHWFDQQARDLLAAGPFERILGSLHTISHEGQPRDVFGMLASGEGGGPANVVRAYLAELVRMIESSNLFQVLAHVDYGARRWPPDAGQFDHRTFEEEYRAVLRALAQSGRALEVNTRLPMDPIIVRWWHEVGGEAVSFGSDAHLPSAVGHGFAEAAAMVEAQGFRPGHAPHDFWRRALVK